MDAASQLAKKYRALFTLPNRNVLLTELLIIALFGGGTAFTISLGIEGSIIGIIDGLASLFVGSLISAYLIHKFDNGGFLTLKRSIAFTMFALFLLVLGLLTGSIVSRLYNDFFALEKAYFISCGIIFSYEYIILKVVSEHQKVTLFIISLLQPLIIILIHTILLINFKLSYINILDLVIYFIIMIAISYVFSKIFYLRIESIGRKLTNVGSITLFKAFIKSLIFDQNNEIENILKQIGIKANVVVKTLSFCCKNYKGLLVAPSIHPGPFKNVGGSGLPTAVARTLRGRSIVPVIFHTPCDHSKDLVSTEDTLRVIKAIDQINISEGVQSASIPTVSKKGDVTITCQVFGDIPLVVITRSPLPTEDLPERINEVCIKKIQEYGYSDGIIVDAHNSMESNYKPFQNEDEQNLVDALSDALAKVTANKSSKLIAGLSNSQFGVFTKRDGVGEGGVMVLVTEVEGEKAAYVSIDSNNMVIGLRERIQKELSKLGYKVTEVTTTDTHVVTGRISGEGYYLLGKSIPEEIIISKVIETVREADSKKCECSSHFFKLGIDEVTLLGERGITLLWKVTDESIRIAKISALGSIIGLFVSSALVFALL